MTQTNIDIVRVNYQDQVELKELIGLLNAYAMDPMGGAEALSSEVQQRLLTELPAQSNMFSLLVRVDGIGVGFCNCLWGFSTFAAQPLVNIHDLAVVAEYRGLGLSQALLQAVVDIAKQGGAVKVTLEVLGNNDVAQQAYRRFGFVPYELSDGAGRAEFWQYYLGTSCSGS
ncbi:MAG: GNAT family N-acetyltransferase [Gammaproteobacteria bacterium]|jgi:GNAT superfamily N-acetyltransferase|nr:GNAT family N-acetyltransferase [Gammaproteobacteria bacterium]